MKNPKRSRLAARTLLGLLVVTLAMALPAPAEAGCLKEHGQCQGCARSKLWRSIVRLDLYGIRDANIDLWDCDIDLYHCIFFGSHHDYPCAA